MGNMVGFYALTGPDDLWNLKQTADEVERSLLNNDKISQIQVIGYSPIIISIEINEEQLLRNNINFDFVSSAIKRSNLDISGGSIKTKKDEIIIRSNNRATTQEEIGNIIVLSEKNGDLVKLSDIADVKLKFSEIPVISYVNGQRAINFLIKKTPEEDIKEIANAVQDYILDFKKES